jgi:hypothetical protein
MKLSKEAYAKAVQYVEQHGRPLDWARLQFALGHADAGMVLCELSKYQNDDGGFGHALEPDVRLADSSVLCTTIALQYARDVDASADDPLVGRALEYLVRTYDPDADGWESVPQNVDDAPHAPWWSFTNAADCGLFNPRAVIAGYLVQWPEHVPAALRDGLLRRLTTDIRDAQEPEDMDHHELLCCLGLYCTPNLSRDVHDRIGATLANNVKHSVVVDETQWDSYVLMPLDAVPTPQSPFGESLSDAISRNLDFVIQQQTPDGSWSPTWSWGDLYPEEWLEARHDWTGWLTVENLIRLKAYGRLPE